VPEGDGVRPRRSGGDESAPVAVATGAVPVPQP
jgi:hypothetical protein